MLKVKYANGKWATLHRLTHVTPETLDHYISFVKWQLSLKNEIYRDEKSFKVIGFEYIPSEEYIKTKNNINPPINPEVNNQIPNIKETHESEVKSINGPKDNLQSSVGIFDPKRSIKPRLYSTLSIKNNQPHLIIPSLCRPYSTKFMNYIDITTLINDDLYLATVIHDQRMTKDSLNNLLELVIAEEFKLILQSDHDDICDKVSFITHLISKRISEIENAQSPYLGSIKEIKDRPLQSIKNNNPSTNYKILPNINKYQPHLNVGGIRKYSNSVNNIQLNNYITPAPTEIINKQYHRKSALKSLIIKYYDILKYKSLENIIKTFLVRNFKKIIDISYC